MDRDREVAPGRVPQLSPKDFLLSGKVVTLDPSIQTDFAYRPSLSLLRRALRARADTAIENCQEPLLPFLTSVIDVPWMEANRRYYPGIGCGEVRNCRPIVLTCAIHHRSSNGDGLQCLDYRGQLGAQPLVVQMIMCVVNWKWILQPCSTACDLRGPDLFHREYPNLVP